MNVIILTITIVVLWTGIKGLSTENVVAAFIIAFGVQWLLGVPQNFTGKFIAWVRLLWLLTVDLWISSIRIAIDVFRPKIPITPGLFKVPSPFTKEHQLVILSNGISVTPGSLTVDADDTTGELIVHLCYGEEFADWQEALNTKLIPYIADATTFECVETGETA